MKRNGTRNKAYVSNAKKQSIFQFSLEANGWFDSIGATSVLVHYPITGVGKNELKACDGEVALNQFQILACECIIGEFICEYSEYCMTAWLHPCMGP